MSRAEVLSMTRLEHFESLLSKWGPVAGVEGDPTEDVKEYVECLKSGRVLPRSNRVKKLERRWYQSIRNGKPPDYGVYGHPDYLCEAWGCWAVYSSASIKALMNKKALGIQSVISYASSARRIVDLGCGLGYTTAAIAQLFPSADVFGTNIESSLQYKIAFDMAERFGFEMRPDPESVGKCDVIFASEYFEHFEQPIEHLFDVLKLVQPKLVITANAFNSDAIGHFDCYVYKGRVISGKGASSLFGKLMRSCGFKKLKTNIWNQRPSVWAR